MADISINSKQVSTLIINDNIVYARYFTPMNYIQSSGTQYIDTGATMTVGTEVEIIYQYVSIEGSYPAVAGCGSGSTAMYMPCLSGSNERWCWGATASTAGKCYTRTADTSKHTTIYNELSTRNIIVDGTTLGAFTPTTVASDTVGLFALHQGGTYNYKSSSKIYAFRMKTSSGLVRNLIPCVLTSAISASKDSQSTARSAGEIGMWDTVTDMFYGNAGTGTFVAG